MINEIMISELIGSGTALAGIIWSIFNKKTVIEEEPKETKPVKKKRYYHKKKEAAK